jgi:hypothetical protein
LRGWLRQIRSQVTTSRGTCWDLEFRDGREMRHQPAGTSFPSVRGGRERLQVDLAALKRPRCGTSGYVDIATVRKGQPARRGDRPRCRDGRGQRREPEQRRNCGHDDPLVAFRLPVEGSSPVKTPPRCAPFPTIGARLERPAARARVSGAWSQRRIGAGSADAGDGLVERGPVAQGRRPLEILARGAHLGERRRRPPPARRRPQAWRRPGTRLALGRSERVGLHAATHPGELGDERLAPVVKRLADAGADCDRYSCRRCSPSRPGRPH